MSRLHPFKPSNHKTTYNRVKQHSSPGIIGLILFGLIALALIDGCNNRTLAHCANEGTVSSLTAFWLMGK